MVNPFIHLAQIRQDQNCPEGSTGASADCLTNIPQVAADGNTLTTALSIVFGIISAVTVIIIIIQAIRFSLSGGDPQKAADARKGIIYAVVGLAISLSANLVVIFLLEDVLSS